MGGTEIRSTILHLTPRWSMFGLNKGYHSISTLPTSHYKYNEWLEKVEIGVWALKWSPPRDGVSGGYSSRNTAFELPDARWTRNTFSVSAGDPL
eukprot:scaffold34309_cov43-Cyclotella_meneghiniana.AAC.1